MAEGLAVTVTGAAMVAGENTSSIAMQSHTPFPSHAAGKGGSFPAYNVMRLPPWFELRSCDVGTGQRLAAIRQVLVHRRPKPPFPPACPPFARLAFTGGSRILAPPSRRWHAGNIASWLNTASMVPSTWRPSTNSKISISVLAFSDNRRRFVAPYRPGGSSTRRSASRETHMTDSTPNKPPRRPRYHGRNPRKFDEKYKEQQPGKHADTVAKVIARGQTPAGTHRPIMVRKVLQVLAPQPGQIAVDCTLGYGGHARELLAAVQPGGRLLAVDRDPIELPKSEARLRAMGFPAESLIVKRMNYAGLVRFLEAEAPYGADVLLADLGLSSMQIDDPARGFTFKVDGALDMRMNPQHGQPASALLSTLSEPDLAQILKDNADEPLANGLARAILLAHDRTPLTTTRELAAVVRSAMVSQSPPSSGPPDDAVRRVFQALRIEVNDEFGSLDAFLGQLPRCLKAGGRVAILSFHSGEDRRVKKAFKIGLSDGKYALISDDVIRPSAEEQRANPRSSAAKLRWAIRATADVS